MGIVAKIIKVAKMSVIAGALEFVGYTIVDYVSSGRYDVGDSIVASVVAALFMESAELTAQWTADGAIW